MLLTKHDGDALMYLRKWLREAVRKAGLQIPRLKGKPGKYVQIPASQAEQDSDLAVVPRDSSTICTSQSSYQSI